MKKQVFQVLSVACLLMGTTNANAQISLGSVLKKATKSVKSSNSGSDTSTSSESTSSTSSSNSSSGLLSGLTSVFSLNKVASAEDLVGTWLYTEPAVVFSSSNVLKSAGGKVASASIEKQLQTKLSAVGITPGKFSMTFDSNGNFTQTASGKTVKGTYTVNGQSVNLKYGGTAKQFVGTTQVDGNDLLIVMDATKLLSFAQTVGSLSGNTTLKTATSLAGSMDGMQCGLRLEKQ